MNETKNETFANRLLCLAAIPSPPPPSPHKKGNRKQEEGTWKAAIIFNTFCVIFSYEGTQPLCGWTVGQKCWTRQNPFCFLVPTAGVPKILMMAKPCVTREPFFSPEQTPWTRGHDRAVHVCGICCTGGKDAAHATHMCSLVTVWATCVASF